MSSTRYGEGLSKLEIASNQITSAIKMLFDVKFDPISTHTLAASGFQILRDFSKKNESKIWSEFTQKFTPDAVKELYKAINEDWNIFKHAASDHDRVYNGLLERRTDEILYFSVRMLEENGISKDEFTVLKVWFASIYIELFKEFGEAVGTDRPPFELLGRDMTRSWGGLLLKRK